MTSTLSLTSDNQNVISTIDDEISHQSNRNTPEKINRLVIKPITVTERIKNYFITNDGRIALADLFFTLLCVVLQHVMGTCHHSFSDGLTAIEWYVFTPPFGAGPHTAVFFFVLSWITLAYCIECIWVYLSTGIRVSKKRDLIIHGLIVILFLIAFGFNIWGYVLCEMTSQVITMKAFIPGVCRGNSKACIPLIAGVLTSFAVACAFFVEHILALTKFLKNRRGMNDTKSPKILL
ncbi:unnamed protein product [Adineta steineri]|uniref:Uncharacterized protein n=1 Tax=Adineta steineri TaxID=433720 RepID=A0A813NFS8_9BILA|nr:unnamed protein product [Adineta steineri]CAF0734339.1 unnamed protein product [Adineta steineri]CAF3477199.1 unnamed protein product [Adineta steineri]CAF3841819.1 unnamed protein product [Adineta steineri]